MKEWLKKLIAQRKADIQKKEEERAALDKKVEACTDINEMKRFNAEARALGETLLKLKNQIIRNLWR